VADATNLYPCRREQQAAAANAALQSQLSQQQHMLEAQQQQLSGMQEQLLQLKDLHKKKLTRYKVQLQQQYESQLAAATSAYTQELSLVHVSNAVATGLRRSGTCLQQTAVTLTRGCTLLVELRT
jgi:hypothetical protein